MELPIQAGSARKGAGKEGRSWAHRSCRKTGKTRREANTFLVCLGEVCFSHPQATSVET